MLKQNDFEHGKVWKNILLQAIPLTVAQLVQLLYNVVDRIYIGHLPDIGHLALTGVGLTFPIITIIAAFTNMFNTGGTPLFSIARGEKDEAKAQEIMGNVFSLILITGLFSMIFCFIFRKPILYLFGASDDSYFYADQYLQIYLLGTIFTMFATGMNGFINAQGFPSVGMLTTILGAILNLILDPIFIFALHLGVRGAAIATVISQFASAVWVFRFLTGKKTLFKLNPASMKLKLQTVKKIVVLGMSGFIVMATNAFVQIACNATLQTYGGDLYVGIMTVLNSVREILSLPVGGICAGSQPVLGYNYGAKRYERVRQAIRFSSILGIGYTILAWAFVFLFPKLLIGIFSNNPEVLAAGPEALHIYFFGFCFMAFQFAGQHTFQALGKAKQSIFFSILRKVVIVVPLTFILPRLGFGVFGVFWAEPISNFLGGMASFSTMYFTVYRPMKKLDPNKN